jgi:iron-sulfur cluster repair protein YtfE (RIC family)
MTIESLLDCTRSVNDTIALYPETISVFNTFGIDSCCGGAVSVEVAARRDQADARRLCDALGQVIRAARG